MNGITHEAVTVRVSGEIDIGPVRIWVNGDLPKFVQLSRPEPEVVRVWSDCIAKLADVRIANCYLIGAVKIVESGIARKVIGVYVESDTVADCDLRPDLGGYQEMRITTEEVRYSRLGNAEKTLVAQCIESIVVTRKRYVAEHLEKKNPH